MKLQKKLMALGLVVALSFGSVSVYAADSELESEVTVQESLDDKTETKAQVSETQDKKAEEKTTVTGKVLEEKNNVSLTNDYENVYISEPDWTMDSELTLYTSEKRTIYSYLYSSTNEKIKWTSSNPKVAKVFSNGNVRGISAGKAIVTASIGKYKKKCKVIVKKPVITLYSSNVVRLYEGSREYVSVDTTPYNIRLKWKSQNPKVARVSNKGEITAVKPGVTKIIAYYGGVKKYITVKVYKNTCKLSLKDKTLMKGNSCNVAFINRSNSSIYPSYSQDNYSKDNISVESCGSWDKNGKYSISYKVKAKHTGKNALIVSFSKDVSGKTVEWNRKCKFTIVNEGIKEQDFAIAKDIKKKLTLKNIGKPSTIKSIKWKSLNRKVAVVSPTTGTIKGKSSGKAKIAAIITYKSGSKKQFVTEFKVTNPKLNKTNLNMKLYSSGKKLKVTGKASDSKVKYKSSKSNVVTVDDYGNLYAKSMGISIITATVDGKSLKCKVVVNDPKLSNYSTMLAKGNTAHIDITGILSGTKISYKTRNGGVATVDGNGNVYAVGNGSTYIDVFAAGSHLKYLVEVAPQRAIDACRKGMEIYNTCTYSQEKRMSDGYYDCSALVFKSYDRDSALLGGSYDWGPTAANMAIHMRDTGKVLSYGAISTTQMIPGDLVFLGGTDNGRYLGIYHVEMYYGGDVFPAWTTANVVMTARPLNE